MNSHGMGERNIILYHAEFTEMSALIKNSEFSMSPGVDGESTTGFSGDYSFQFQINLL